MLDLFLILTLLLAIGAIEFLHFRNHALNASAVETIANIGVYWDKKCTIRVYSIDWGVLTPGQTKQVTVYVRNEGNEPIFLSEESDSWNPANAPQYLDFSWQCQNSKIEIGAVVTVTQILHVSPNIRDISNFSFNIIFEERNHLLGDINLDGIVDMTDVVIVCEAYGSTPKDPNWNPYADLNNDGVIDIIDVTTVTINYGGTS
jgi:hypothetical protein